MKIYNEDKTKVLSKEECDIENGYFIEEKIITGHRSNLMEKIINIDGSESVTQYPEADIKESILVYKPFSEKDKYDREKVELERWFETEYREMFEKCTRRISLGTNMSDGLDPRLKLNQLYTEAENKANRINQLKTLINKL